MSMGVNKVHYAILVNFFSSTSVSKSLKILVVRFSSIGDIVLTTPVIRVLKKQLNAEVHYLTKNAYSSLLKNNPNLNKVALIEPNAVLAMSLKKRFEHDERTIIVNLGLDYRKDYIPFDVPSEGDSHGNFSSSIFSSPSEISGIETTTVDELLNELNFESLDLLKLDLEGFDHYALLGARNSFANNKIRMVQLEVTRCWEQSGSSPCSALRFLNNAGFKIFLLKRNSLEALNNISDMTHFSLYCNFIGIHKMYFEKEKETR